MNMETERNWFKTIDKVPEKDAKVIAIGSLSSGRDCIYVGSICGEWFIDSSGGMCSLNIIKSWSYATPEESEKYWDLNNWTG